MTKSRILFSFLLFVLLLAGYSQPTSAQTLPEKARAFLDQKYPGWKLFPETPSCRIQAVETQGVKIQAVVSGDFDGNKKWDYAVYFQHRGSPRSVAFFSNGKEYKAIDLPELPESAWGERLTVTPKGLSYDTIDFSGSQPKLVPDQKLKTDTLTLEKCGRDGRIAVRNFYIYSDGEFRGVVPRN